jgi:hypothetical protein
MAEMEGTISLPPLTIYYENIHFQISCCSGCDLVLTVVETVLPMPILSPKKIDIALTLPAVSSHD